MDSGAPVAVHSYLLSRGALRRIPGTGPRASLLQASGVAFVSRGVQSLTRSGSKRLAQETTNAVDRSYWVRLQIFGSQYRTIFVGRGGMDGRTTASRPVIAQPDFEACRKEDNIPREQQEDEIHGCER